MRAQLAGIGWLVRVGRKPASSLQPVVRCLGGVGTSGAVANGQPPRIAEKAERSRPLNHTIHWVSWQKRAKAIVPLFPPSLRDGGRFRSASGSNNAPGNPNTSRALERGCDPL